MKILTSRLNLVTGGAGFIGSNIVDYLLKKNEKVICLDDFSSGNISNLLNARSNPNFSFVKHDVRKFIDITNIDNIWHFAAIASPYNYLRNPIETSSINFIGTSNMLELARKNRAQFLFASTSEIYGQVKDVPINEESLGTLKTFSPRSCYFESKRLAESLCFDYARKFNMSIKVVRIFNTYGPKMSLHDGRVVGNFINQCFNSKPLTIFGDGEQTRSFCYITDLVSGLIKIMESNLQGPVNLGNPNQITIKNLAEIISSKLNSNIDFDYKPKLIDEPRNRKPSIALIQKNIQWEPIVNIYDGLDLTINFLKNHSLHC